MPRTETVTRELYLFDELSDEAKERAREWYRDADTGDSYWAEFVIEDAARIGELLGIGFDTRAVGGSRRQIPHIWWSGFWSQGDGACFEGVYEHRKGSLKALKAEIGTSSHGDKELLRIARGLNKAQASVFYQAQARVTHRGRYYHENSVDIDVTVTHPGTGEELDFYGYRAQAACDMIEELLRDFCRWIYRQLRDEWEYQNSDEAVDESIRMNGYEFTERGERA